MAGLSVFFLYNLTARAQDIGILSISNPSKEVIALKHFSLPHGLVPLLALALVAASAPLGSQALESMFWFFTYRFTIAPILVLAPVFALLGLLVPLAVCRAVSRHTIVERLREVE